MSDRERAEIALRRHMESVPHGWQARPRAELVDAVAAALGITFDAEGNRVGYTRIIYCPRDGIERSLSRWQSEDGHPSYCRGNHTTWMRHDTEAEPWPPIRKADD